MADTQSQFIWRGAEVVAQVKKWRKKLTLQVAEKVLADAKINCPYDRSPTRDPNKIHLRDSGKIVILPDGKVEIRFTAFWAGYVHDGTHKMAARPFLAQALMKNAPELKVKTTQVLTGLSLSGDKS